MKQEAGHHHSHRHGKRALKRALAITAIWCALEVAAGLYTNSLALLADAAHMLTDLAALGMSLFALKIAERPATQQKTYGYLRAEILAALANGIFLGLVAAYILYEAYLRAFSPPEVRSLPMLLVAVTGLGANLVTAALLFGSQHDSLNIRSAFAHIVGDALGSLGAIAAGVAMLLWQWYLADPIASAAVALLVLFSAWRVVRESVDILLEAVPRHLEVSRILADLGSVRGVVSVHDLHVWSITSGMPALSCHVVLRHGTDPTTTLSELSRAVREGHGITHTTIQIEFESLVVPSPRI